MTSVTYAPNRKISQLFYDVFIYDEIIGCVWFSEQYGLWLYSYDQIQYSPSQEGFSAAIAQLVRRAGHVEA